MKEAVSFSANDVERTSLNFSELRELGIKYIQEVSGDEWTDYNAHDPGITILEQLCFAITDNALRTSLPVNDLLIRGEDTPIDANGNGFFSPAAIFSTHPVTTGDTRAFLIDRFTEIQNAWITPKETSGYRAEINGINRVEILPKINFVNEAKTKSTTKSDFIRKVNSFLQENRNIGETFENVVLLEPQLIHVNFEIYVDEKDDLELILSNVFLKLFEFIYTPVQFKSFNDLEAEGKSLEEIFSGPELNRGFLTDDLSDERVTRIEINELQKLISKIRGISKCNVYNIRYNKQEYEELNTEINSFFHLLEENDFGNTTENQFEEIYSNMRVFVNNKQVHAINKQHINKLFLENWAKKHRGFSLGISEDEFYTKKLQGNYMNIGEYSSIQNHFPIIYGIGKEGLSQHDPAERHAQAFQLKAYLMLFEQHLANHLSQLQNLNSLFNIRYSNVNRYTAFAQKVTIATDYEKLVNNYDDFIKNELLSEELASERKNKVYNHLLARFGESLNETPWKIAFRINLIKSERELNDEILQHKSKLLRNLKTLSRDRVKGESVSLVNNNEFRRYPSGLENIIQIKTGIKRRTNKGLKLDLSDINSDLSKVREDPVKDITEFHKMYRPLHASEIQKNRDQIQKRDIPYAMFGEIGLKTLFKETLAFKNYRLSIPGSESENVQVIFQKQPNIWVNLFECSNAKEAVNNVLNIVDFFTSKNWKSEGFYLVDHILLNDCLADTTYGFSFHDEYDHPLFETCDEESWCASEEEREQKIKDFFECGVSESAYFIENGVWKIKDNKGKTLANLVHEENPNDSVEGAEQIFKRTKSLIRFFRDLDSLSGRKRLYEVEKIRLEGVEAQRNHFGQRRLVLQRKTNNNRIIDEDFFDLNISLVLPDWPARFQEERFKDFITDILRERTPLYLTNRVLWLNANQMASFHDKYGKWEKLKAAHQVGNPASNDLQDAAFDVYSEIKKLAGK